MRVAVAVSGGSDSLLALGLLRAAGHVVLALHAHFLPPDARQRDLAQAIAEQCASLGVAFVALDLSREFALRVIAPFMTSYAQGETPNPCAICNRDMKFGLLLEAAGQSGADRLATGHFARLHHAADRVELVRGADASRDQSYFLSLVRHDALTKALFPLADRRKADNPATLAKLGLTPPLPKESREVCFVPNDDYRSFLEQSATTLSGPGTIVLADGTPLGTHQGLWRHTIGQRKGLGIAYAEPLYVLAKDARKNQLIVGVAAELAATTCHTAPANLLVPPSTWPRDLLAQTCYRMRPRPVTARVAPDDSLDILFDTSVTRPTPGQIATLYDLSGRVLAGGVLRA